MSTTAAVTSSTRLSWEDIIIVVIYFLAVIAVGIYASCRASRNTVSGYFLAGRSMMFYTVGASLFVSNIGSEHFIGLAGSGAAGGIGVGAWEFNALLMLQLLGFIFVPVYIACQTYTMPEYLSKRFGGRRIRVYFAILSLILYIFTKCSVNLYTGALFIQQSLGWDLYLSILLQIGIVAVLTITGGLTAVIYTDTLQAVLMIVGALGLMAKGFYDIGGFNELWRRYPLAVTNMTVPNTTCHEVNPNWNVMLRDPSDPEMPWPGFLLGQTPGSLWYWCSDQVIVQRALAAKSLSHSQGATILAGFAKVLPLFMMVMPGMMARVLYPDEVGCVDPDVCWQTCQSHAGCSNIAYPKLVLGIMPKGARGVMMAVLLAALMSDLDSIFNSASTMFTIDIYQTMRPKASVKELMVVGRLFVVVMVGVAIAWVPVVKETQGGQVFIYIQEVSLYLAPPVACIYVLAVLWPRCNEQGAFWGLMAGFVTGVTRLILVFVYRAPEVCGEEDLRPGFIRNFHYMYFAIMLFWITFVVAVVVSLVTEPPTYDQLYRTTYWTRLDKMDKQPIEGATELRTTWDRLSCCFSIIISRDANTQTYDNATLEEDSENASNEKCISSSAQLSNSSRDRNDGRGRSSKIEPTATNGNVNFEMNPIDDDITPAEQKTGQVLPELTDSDDSKSEKAMPPGDDPPPTKEKRKRSWQDLFFSWFCGLTSAEDDGESEEAKRAAVEREEMICSLQQDPRTKLFLHVMLIIIICTAVFLYCFFSLWRYTVPNNTT